MQVVGSEFEVGHIPGTVCLAFYRLDFVIEALLHIPIGYFVRILCQQTFPASDNRYGCRGKLITARYQGVKNPLAKKLISYPPDTLFPEGR